MLRRSFRVVRSNAAVTRPAFAARLDASLRTPRARVLVSRSASTVAAPARSPAGAAQPQGVEGTAVLRLRARNLRIRWYHASAEKGKEAAFSIKGTTLDGRSIYLDMQATTPGTNCLRSRCGRCAHSSGSFVAVDPRVLDAMMPFYTQQYGNPHSRTHHFGWESEEAVEAARQVDL